MSQATAAKLLKSETMRGMAVATIDWSSENMKVQSSSALKTSPRRAPVRTPSGTASSPPSPPSDDAFSSVRYFSSLSSGISWVCSECDDMMLGDGDGPRAYQLSRSLMLRISK